MPHPDPALSNQRRITLCGTWALDDALRGLIAADADKAAVLEWLAQLIADGLAEWSLVNNDIRVCFASGEVFLLAANGMRRLA